MLYKAQLSMLVHKQYISMTMLDNLCLLLKSPTSVVRVSDRHFSRGNLPRGVQPLIQLTDRHHRCDNAGAEVSAPDEGAHSEGSQGEAQRSRSPTFVPFVELRETRDVNSNHRSGHPSEPSFPPLPSHLVLPKSVTHHRPTRIDTSAYILQFGV